MTIESLEYFSRSGIVCEGIFGINRFPYSSSDVQHDGGPIGARWKQGELSFSWKTTDKVSIYPSPDMRFLVAVFLRNAPMQFSPPHNAVVLDADGALRHHVRQPARYAGRATEFLDAWWYERDEPQPRAPWWAFWRKPIPPKKQIRMKMLIGWVGDPNCAFEALDFDPESDTFGNLVDSGRF